MRAVWPAAKPMSVRISATDWVEGGITGDDAVLIARAFRDGSRPAGRLGRTNLHHGQARLWPHVPNPFSDRIRNEAGVPTMAVGNITEPD